MSAVRVEDLRVELAASRTEIVSEVSFSMNPGEVVGLVGESGSGKTTVAMALLAHARRGARIAAGSVLVDGTDVLQMSGRELRAARGKVVAYIPQDPYAALNPALRVSRQLEEVIEVHAPDVDAEERIREVLAEVALPSDPDFLRRYPHQLSGGQQQRIAIAMAFLLRPPVIVLDEPTTGLDVMTQARVLDTIRSLCAKHRVSALYVTHDLAVVSNLADHIMVMYAGRLVEGGGRHSVFARPAHPYTAKLLAAIPDLRGRYEIEPIPGQAPLPGKRPGGCSFAPRCPLRIELCERVEPPLADVDAGHSARCHRAAEVAELLTLSPRARLPRAAGAEALLSVRGIDAYHGSRRIVRQVSFDLDAHECVALVGESGSGKTTLSLSLVGLHPPHSGSIEFRGGRLEARARERGPDERRAIQYIFQSPFTSLNPRRTAAESVAAPLEQFWKLRGAAARARVDAALERVALPSGLGRRYPSELSGGERQRVAIARALVCDPEVLICDEITSALDVSVQAAIIRLLADLRRDEGLTMLFVTHNLALVRLIADRLIVLRDGEVVEAGETERVFSGPQHPYTQSLLAETPAVDLEPAGGSEGRARDRERRLA